MLDFGFSEILLTSAIALVVLGPERLPKVARQVGNWMGRARLMARQLSEQLEREVNAEELLREHMKTPLRPDPPPRIAAEPPPQPVSEPADSLPADSLPAGALPHDALPAEAAGPRLPDGHATTPAAMHPPTQAPSLTADPHPSNQ